MNMIDSEECVVEALDHGADDYMVKPVTKAVTMSRINALQRRNRINAESDNSDDSDTTGDDFAPYEIDRDECSISLNGEKIKLTYKEFELAAYL